MFQVNPSLYFNDFWYSGVLFSRVSLVQNTEAYLRPCRLSLIELFEWFKNDFRDNTLIKIVTKILKLKTPKTYSKTLLRNRILENNSPKQLFISLLRTSKENTRKNHFVKSVRIWSYSGPHFPAFGQNSERYKNLSVISLNAGKYKDQNNSEYGHFSRSRWKT